MDTEQVKDEESLYHAAAAKPITERAAYLGEVCKDDPALLARVTVLLQSRAELGDFLEAPPLGENVVLDDSLVVEGPGTVIGRYQLLEKIGEGGMAVVYMAESATGGPIRRKVALKIIKLGMDTKQVIARFEAERQALALMDHPSIAKVLDAGATETGRPYFVMELVQGVSITEYCDRNSLGTKDRLGLFIQVCHAVQHAHQKGIIHRDIKPSNVMVTHHDGKPVPKVIDFGIAKAINQKLTEKTLFTRYAHLIGTPAYMSPEQAELSDLDIDTRTDIYSLGVLLYELLTGTTPFSEEDLRKAGYVEMQRVIREQEPVKPSTKLTTLGETLTDVAECRNSTPDLLRKAIRGDLDWIVMKSLEKDRAHRYETASGLAEEVRRHLEHEPVLARGPSTAYRLQKFVGKHRIAVMFASTIALVLIGGLLVTTTSYIRIKRAQDQVASLEEQVETDRQLSTAQRLYAEGSYQAALAQIESSLLNENPEPKTRLLYAQVLSDVGRCEEAEAQLESLLDGEPGIAGAAHSLLARLHIATDPAESRKHQELADELAPQTAEAFTLRAMTTDSPDVTIDWLSKAVQLDPGHYPTRRARTLAYYAIKDYASMEQESEILIAMRPRDPLGYALRAIARRHRGKFQDAVPDHTQAIGLCPAGPELPILYAQRGQTYEQMGDYQAAMADARRCIELDPNDRGAYCRQFACLVALGDFDGAKRVYEATSNWTEWHRTPFTQWIQKHVFDVLSAGRSLDLPANLVGQPPFSAMQEAIDAYRRMVQRAHRLVPSALGVMTWSPDGKKLAYGRSERYTWVNSRLPSQQEALSTSTGIEVFDLDTRESRLLVYSGKDPAWSPDGRYIAYVGWPGRYLYLKEELWIIPASGGEPRRLTTGGFPFWSPDSKTVFFRRMEDMCVYSIGVDDPDARPQRAFPFPSSLPSISADARYVAFGCGSDFRVVEIASGAVVNGWFSPVPEAWSGLHGDWSADGAEIAICSTSGVWVFNIRDGDARRVFTGYINSARWSLDRSQLAICLTTPVEELWLARIDPNRPTYESLEPALTRADYLRCEVLKKAEQRALRDPNDADAHLSCAVTHVLLGNHAEASAALERFNASNRKDCMIDGIPSPVKDRRLSKIRQIRELTRFGETQYLMGRYEDALRTLEGAAMLRQGVEGQSDPQAIALTAMGHYRLGQRNEARACLVELRRIVQEGESPYANKWLCETEQLLAQEDSGIHNLWTAIVDGRLEDATNLLRALGASPQGNTPEAAADFNGIRTVLTRAFRSRGKQTVLSGGSYRSAIEDYEAAAAISPDGAHLFSDLGWLLASCPTVELRDGPRAIAHATQACELTSWQNHQCIAILAAVYAKLGNFSAAAKWQQEANRLLSPQDRPRWEVNYSSRLTLYEEGRSYDELCPWSPSTGELVACWKLDEVADGLTPDSSVNRLDGRLTGGAAIVPDAERGNVLSIHGLDDRVYFGDRPPLNCVDEVTAACWFKTVKPFLLYHHLFRRGYGAWMLRLSGDPGGALFSCCGVSCEAWPGNRACGTVHSEDDLSDGQWHHVAGTYDGQYLRLYVDGVLVRRVVAWGRLNITEEAGFMGANADPQHDCRIDDVRIYNYAISDADVKRLAERPDPDTEPD